MEAKKRMAGECDKPKKDDPPAKGTPKGDKGKADKGKSKGKQKYSGKGKPQVKQLMTEKKAEETANQDGREFRREGSDPKEPEREPEHPVTDLIALPAFGVIVKVVVSPLFTVLEVGEILPPVPAEVETR